MNKHSKRLIGPAAAVTAIAMCIVGGPAAHAADKAPVTLAKCDAPLGTIAVVDGDTQGWTKYGLESPRGLIAAMATESGCFTVHSSASGQAADFLINAIAGDKEEVDKGVEKAKTAVLEGAVRSGFTAAAHALRGAAVGALAGNVPVLGGMMGMFGGFGGKKKTIAAGLRVIDPRSGQTLVAGSGVVTKSTVTFGGMGGVANAAGGYGSSKDGQQLATAFVKAFNGVVGQASALQTAKAALPAAAPAAAPGYVVAVDTQMYATPAKGTALRALRSATTLTPTGKRDGLFVEVRDSVGTQGWVSVEDLK